VNTSRHSQIILGLKDSIPIVVAYFPIAATFGVIGTNSGISWWNVALISVLVYAGAAQFMLVSFAASGMSVFSAVTALLLVNFRHFLYGTSLGPAFSEWPERRKWVAAFGLTDEVFAVTSSRLLNDPPTPAYQITFSFACYFSWVIGTLVGIIIGQVVPTAVSNVLVFALPALFLAILFSSYRTVAHLISAAFAALCAILLRQHGLGSTGMLVGAVLGATVGYLIHRFSPNK
jgi:4-azaleucine resistance transporter AzlC